MQEREKERERKEKLMQDQNNLIKQTKYVSPIKSNPMNDSRNITIGGVGNDLTYHSIGITTRNCENNSQIAEYLSDNVNISPSKFGATLERNSNLF